MSISAARSRLALARDNLSTNRVDEVAPLLEAAEGFLAGQAGEDCAPLLAELAELRAELDNTPSPDDQRFLAAARNQLRHARGELEEGRGREPVEQSLDRAEEYLGNARERFRGPLQAEMDQLRALLGGAPAGADPVPHAVPSVPTVPSAVPSVSSAVPSVSSAVASVPSAVQTAVPPVVPSAVPLVAGDEEHRGALRQARTRVGHARSLVEAGAVEAVEQVLAEALGLLASVPDAMRAELLADVEDIRVARAAAERAEAVRGVTLGLDVQLTAVQSAVSYENWADGGTALRGFAERFAREDVARVLPPQLAAHYEQRAAALAATVAAGVKAEQLGRAQAALAEVEHRLDGDPPAELDRDGVHRLAADVAYLSDRVRRELSPVPPDDPDVRAVRDRLAAAQERLDAGLRDWERAATRRRAADWWESARQDIAGWRDEALDAAPPSLYSPNLPLTDHAVRRLRSLLEDADAVRLRADHPHDEAIQATFRAAGAALSAAAAKLAAGFERILAHAEAMPAPMREEDLQQTVHLAAAARSMLEGTGRAEPVLARVAALEQRWRDEYDREMAARVALFEKLSAEADAAWPGIVAAAGATVPGDAGLDATEGRPVLLSGVYNRCGWEWSGREYGFAARHGGIVLAGVYEPHVLAALEHAWYELKLDVNDRIAWDVLAVPDGPGTIGERTQRTLRAAGTGAELGTVEEWPPVPCLRLRVVGLHAGPVAVGP
jgi:hypothetical protein